MARHSRKIHFSRSIIENGKIVGKRYKTACNLTLVNDHIGHASFNRFKESLKKWPDEVCKNCQREYYNFIKEIKEYKRG